MSGRQQLLCQIGKNCQSHEGGNSLCQEESYMFSLLSIVNAVYLCLIHCVEEELQNSYVILEHPIRQ